MGGMTGHDNYVLDDICYLDLKTWTWSRIWKFVPRYDHTSWISGGRIWVFGGMGEEMERTSELWWLDLRGSPAFESSKTVEAGDRRLVSWRQSAYPQQGSMQLSTSASGYAANSSSTQSNSASALVSRTNPIAPGAISSLRFIASPHLPAQALGHHFHIFTSGYLLDFVTPASVISSFDTSLSALELDTLRWQKLADGKDLFNPNYRWHYCTTNEDGTQAWLLGCPPESSNPANGTTEELLSDVLHIDLRKLGILGNKLAAESKHTQTEGPTSDATPSSGLSAIGADLSRMFDEPPESGSGTDFIVTGETDDADAMETARSTASNSPASKSVHVHKLILQARWPHFARLYSSQMIEFHTKKLALPEPYTTVRAFLYYLYTDSITQDPEKGPTLPDVAGMLVMANMYDMPRLRLLCIDRLGKELDVEHAAIIWERASVAGEEWLRKRAARYCMCHWGRIVRTDGFKSLPQQSLVEICEEIDEEGRIVGGAELEIVGGLGGAKFGVNGLEGLKKRGRTAAASTVEDDAETDGDEGMDVS